MVFPLLIVSALAATGIVSTGIAVGAAKFGQESGEQAGWIVGIGAVAIIAYFILVKRK